MAKLTMPKVAKKMMKILPLSRVRSPQQVSDRRACDVRRRPASASTYPVVVTTMSPKPVVVMVCTPMYNAARKLRTGETSNWSAQQTAMISDAGDPLNVQKILQRDTSEP